MQALGIGRRDSVDGERSILSVNGCNVITSIIQAATWQGNRSANDGSTARSDEEPDAGAERAYAGGGARQRVYAARPIARARFSRATSGLSCVGKADRHGPGPQAGMPQLLRRLRPSARARAWAQARHYRLRDLRELRPGRRIFGRHGRQSPQGLGGRPRLQAFQDHHRDARHLLELPAAIATGACVAEILCRNYRNGIRKQMLAAIDEAIPSFTSASSVGSLWPGKPPSPSRY